VPECGCYIIILSSFVRVKTLCRSFAFFVHGFFFGLFYVSLDIFIRRLLFDFKKNLGFAEKKAIKLGVFPGKKGFLCHH